MVTMDDISPDSFEQITLVEDLPRDECLRLLATRTIGRVGFVHDGHPMVLPVQYVYVAGAVVVRTAYGSAFDRAVCGVEVAFEIDAVDPGYHAGWSVMARGIAQGLDEPAVARLLDETRLRPWGLELRPGWVRITLTEVTGRRIIQERFVGWRSRPVL